MTTCVLFLTTHNFNFQFVFSLLLLVHIVDCANLGMSENASTSENSVSYDSMVTPPIKEAVSVLSSELKLQVLHYLLSVVSKPTSLAAENYIWECVLARPKETRCGPYVDCSTHYSMQQP